MSFPARHRAKLHGINPLERLNGEIRRRTEAVGAILLEQNDEWAVRRARFMTPEILAIMSDDPLVSLPAVPA
jgi:putative transposase